MACLNSELSLRSESIHFLFHRFLHICQLENDNMKSEYLDHQAAYSSLRKIFIIIYLFFVIANSDVLIQYLAE